MKLAIYPGPSLEGDINAALASIEATLACISLGGARMVDSDLDKLKNWRLINSPITFS